MSNLIEMQAWSRTWYNDVK